MQDDNGQILLKCDCIVCRCNNRTQSCTLNLQDKCTQLEKALKTTAQQKELLQHEALKIDRDIEDKRSKYQETLDSVHTLIASSRFNSKDGATARTNNVEREGLTGGHIAQLRKMNQLASAQLEKTGHELKGRLLEVGRKKKELEHQIRCVDGVRTNIQNFVIVQTYSDIHTHIFFLSQSM